MLLRLLCLFLFINSYAQEIKILSQKLEKKGDKIFLNGDVSIYGDEYFVNSNKGIYDQKTKDIFLSGDVFIIRDNNEILKSDKLKLNLSDKNISFENLFLSSKDIRIWLKSKYGDTNDDYYISKANVVSSCNVTNPDWSIETSYAKLNKKSKFIHLYNSVFKIGSVPVFYLPYFGFSTNTKRYTGLLQPKFGFSRQDGFYYNQAIYFAPANNWDFQIDSHFRFSRGLGLFGELRLLDSPYSYLNLNFGSFWDSEYYQKNQAKFNSNKSFIRNLNHRGIGLKYQSSKIFIKNLKEGFYVDLNYANDIDYLDLLGKKRAYDSLINSKINYFVRGDKNYFGIYGKYYFDTQKNATKNGNKDTLQELPSLNYHKFKDNFLLKNLLYSFDGKFNRYYREIGVSANQFEFKFPINFNFNFLDDYLSLGLEQDFYLSLIEYKNKVNNLNEKNIHKYEKYFSLNHKISLNTDLAKAYGKYFHTLNFNLKYNVPTYKIGDLNQKFIYDKNLVPYENFLYREKSKKKLTFEINQYLYNNGSKIIYHNFWQSINKNGLDETKNSLYIYPSNNFSLFNKISIKDKKIENIRNGIEYFNDNLYTRISYLHKNNINSTDNYLNLDLNIKLPKYYEFSSSVDYDLSNKKSKYFKLSLSHKRKCWDYSIMYQSDLEPTATINGVAGKRSSGIYFHVSFYPIGGLDYNFSLNSNK